MKLLSSAAMLAMASIVSPEGVLAEQTVSFRFGGMEFETHIPDGYCLPRGRDIDVAQLRAAADDQNVTHLTLYRCQEAGVRRDYILIKTPNAALPLRLPRQSFLAGVGEAFDSGPLRSDLASGEMVRQVEDRVSSVIGREVDLTGSIRPLGRDDVCAYLGGTMQVSSSTLTYSVSLGTCITVVSNRVITINWYGPDNGSAGIADLLRHSRRLAEQIQARRAP